MWKGMENWARKCCLFLCTILFEVTWVFWKMCWWFLKLALATKQITAFVRACKTVFFLVQHFLWGHLCLLKDVGAKFLCHYLPQEEIDGRFFWHQVFEFFELFECFMVVLHGKKYWGPLEFADGVLGWHGEGSIEGLQRPVRLQKGVLNLCGTEKVCQKSISSFYSLIEKLLKN